MPRPWRQPAHTWFAAWFLSYPISGPWSIVAGTLLARALGQPYKTTQAPERSDILNVGGFSDAVFSVVTAFLADDNGRFVAEVEAVEL